MTNENRIIMIRDKCEHENKTYQAEEKDTNVGESYTCEDCGADLDIPEPDEDTLRDR